MIETATELKDLTPKYLRLAQNTESALRQFLAEEDVASFDVEHRVKDEKSFMEKAARKAYKKPLEEMEDIAGVRVICYYKNDLKKIDEIIEKQFKIISRTKKSEELDVDQFGYTSNHYVVIIKESWLGAPNYSGLNDLKIEIQVRTMLMHTWAAISHKLLYKRPDDVPNEFKRKLNRLSALIELADEQFDDIKTMKVEYQKELVVDKDTAINADNLLAVMRKHFGNRSYREEDIPNFLSELREYSTGLQDFERRLIKCLPVLRDMEQEEHPNKDLPVWGYTGVGRTVLDLTSDEYWKKRTLPEEWTNVTNKYRKILKR